MDELLRLLKINCAPDTDGKEFVHVICGVGFEPHGRTSETWEIYWTLTLPQIPHHWKSITGWQRGAIDKPISFSGHTFDNAIQQAVAFLKETQSA